MRQCLTLTRYGTIIQDREGIGYGTEGEPGYGGGWGTGYGTDGERVRDRWGPRYGTDGDRDTGPMGTGIRDRWGPGYGADGDRDTGPMGTGIRAMIWELGTRNGTRKWHRDRPGYGTRKRDWRGPGCGSRVETNRERGTRLRAERIRLWDHGSGTRGLGYTHRIRKRGRGDRDTWPGNGIRWPLEAKPLTLCQIWRQQFVSKCNYISNTVFGFALAIIVPEIMEIFWNDVWQSRKTRKVGQFLALGATILTLAKKLTEMVS